MRSKMWVYWEENRYNTFGGEGGYEEFPGQKAAKWRLLLFCPRMSSNQGMKDTKEKTHFHGKGEKRNFGVLWAKFFSRCSSLLRFGFFDRFSVSLLFSLFLLLSKNFWTRNETKGKSSKIKNNNVTNSWLVLHKRAERNCLFQKVTPW